MKKNRKVHGVLFLYFHYWDKNAPTIIEHISSFSKYSKFKVWGINTERGFPAGLKSLEFDIIVLHYSLLGPKYLLFGEFLEYLKNSRSSYKIAFFQDEHHYCQQRFAFLNDYNIDCVYTLLHPDNFKDVYEKYTGVKRLIQTLTGYVDDNVIKNAKKYSKPDNMRDIDIGYRARKLDWYMGKGAQEKSEIGEKFIEHAGGTELKLDIATAEGDRLYGNKWYKFLGNQRACLGVEAGVSIYDIQDVVRPEWERLRAENPSMTFAEMSECLFNKWEGNIPYRTISPRVFEAAAFHICQILYEGEYQGILKPMVDYIPLKKDFSNFDEVIKLFHDTRFRKRITENCYQHLIASGEYTYRKFIDAFDEELVKQGYNHRLSRDKKQNIMAWFALNKDMPSRIIPRYVIYVGNKSIEKTIPFLGKLISSTDFGKKFLMPILKPAFDTTFRFIYVKLVRRFYDYGK